MQSLKTNLTQLLESLTLFRRCLITQRSKDARQKQLCKLRGLYHTAQPISISISKPAQKERISLWKWNKIKTKFSATAKHQKLQSVQRTKRRSIVDKNRGLYFSGIFNLKTNLGNHLHITELLLSDLNRCPSVALESQPMKLDDLNLSLVSTIGVPQDKDTLKLLHQAEDLLFSTFSKQNLVVDLIHTWEDQFASSFIIKDKVIAVTEYTMMQKYLWIESISVDQEYRKRGIGRYLIQK